jgi:hypothetical protein
MTAIPLMAVYAIAKRNRTILPFVFLALPLAVLFGYERWTAALYGHGMLSDAANAAAELQWAGDQKAWSKFLIGLSFSGAVVPGVFFLSPRLFSRRLLAGSAVTALAAALLLVRNPANAGSVIDLKKIQPFLAIELVLLIVSGLVTLALGVSSLKRRMAPEVVLLSLWLLGTFVYSSFVNWTINEPPLMLIGPPAAILLSRRLAGRGAPSVRWVAASLTVAAILSLAVCWGDYCFANAGRAAAERVMSLPRPEGSTVWFQGHWGFQYYMEERGAQAVDFTSTIFEPGDLIVLPRNNSLVLDMHPRYIASSEVVKLAASVWVTTMSSAVRAGFYSHLWGPVPFTFGPIPLEKYDVVTFRDLQTE